MINQISLSNCQKLTPNTSGQHLKYSCSKCDSKFQAKSNLKTHKMNKHEHVKYECEKCDYKATQ